MTLRRRLLPTITGTDEPALTVKEKDPQGRIGRIRPVAVIDIGSNSVRQVIYEGLTRSPAVLFNEKVLCGLGRGVATTGRLEDQAVERAIAALRRFRALGRRAEVAETHILATAAARDAENGPEFLETVEEMFGRAPMLLTGRMEAQYCAWGIKSGFFRPNGIAGDLGGGSLELVPINGEIEGGVTLPLGGLRLADLSNGSSKKALEIARKEITQTNVGWPGTDRKFYAVGGTWRSLGKLHMATRDYPLNVLHDYTIESEEMLEFCDRVTNKSIDGLAGIDSVSRNRRSLLQNGAIVMAEVLKHIGAKSVSMSSLGVREGYLYSLLKHEVQSQDSLLAAAYDVAILRARSPRHSVELAEWTGKAFATLRYSETEDEERWRIASCYLADIAWRAHPDYRAQQSLTIIANAGFVGISHEGRAFLSMANFFRYRGLGTKVLPPEISKLASERTIKRARLLAALFRVLYLFSASQPGFLPRLGITRSPEGDVEIIVPADMADLIGERPAERVSQLGKELGAEIRIVLSDG
ncbi:MAG: Ppx/GppA family phosphatase [Rhizobiaceae bacterium]